MRTNLFSPTRAVNKEGYTHELNRNEAVLKDKNGNRILSGTVDYNNTIVIRMKHPNNEANSIVWKEVNTKSPDYLRKLHSRMGHRHISKFDRDCEYCLAIKTTSQRYLKVGSKNIIEGRIFADLMGPFGGESGIRGYVAVIVVDHSDETIALILDSKNEFFEKWISLWMKIETAYGIKIKEFQCDGGGEFINKGLIKWASEHGIQITQSNPYAHTQNSIVERRNRTLRESALTMCLQADMNFDMYWPSAITCAAYTLNLIESSRTNLVPYQARTRRKPELKYMRPYGHIGFMSIPKETRRKNEIRAVKVRMLGYTGNGYFLEENNGKLHYSRDVRWLEEPVSLKLPIKFTKDDQEDEESSTDSIISRSAIDEENVFSNHTQYESDGSFHSAFGNNELEENDEVDNNELEENVEVDNNELEENDEVDQSEIMNTIDKQLEFEEQRSNIDSRNILSGKRTRKTIAEIEIENKLKEACAIYQDMHYSEALNTSDKKEWTNGIKMEYKNLIELGSFVEICLPKGRKKIDTRWVMHRKTDGRFRPRLVIKGFQQIPGLDFTNSFAPVAGYHIFRLVLAISASNNLLVKTFDCSTAFAQNDIDEEVYISIPEGYEEFCRPLMNKKNLIESSTKVLLLKKTINGLIQGAFNQYRNMGKTFAKEGFKVDPNEPGLFYNISKKGIIIIALWVDDFIIAYSREVEKEALAIIMRLTPNLLLKETKGKLLGMELVETDEAFYLSSTRYIEDKISEMKLPILTDNQYKVKTPIHYKDEVKPEDEYDPKLLLEYQKVIGSLIHASNSLRMDISYSVGVLSRNITRVDKNLLDIAYRVMNYLYTTKNYRLSFKRRKEETKLSAYVDADFAGDYESRKSTTGFII